MRLKYLFSLLNTCKMGVNPLVFPHRYCHFKISSAKSGITCKKFVSTSVSQRRIRQDTTDSEDEGDTIDTEKYMKSLQGGYARDLLFKNSKDLLLNRIYCCASVEELFLVLKINSNHYKCEHFLQTVFVLNDLMKIYEEFTGNGRHSPKTKEVFFEKLQEDPTFQKLLRLIQSKVNLFDTTTLSYCVFYLNKLGLKVETPTMQMLCEKLKKRLLDSFCISSASRFLKTVFSESNLRPYFMSQELIPLVINSLDSCNSSETLKHLSICLNKLHNVVTEKNLDKYKTNVKNMISNGSLTSTDHQTVLQIIAFLNYPKWRDKNTALISKCILLIRDNLNQLNINEVTLLYEIFFKLQEPGYILNNLQRCCYKYFHELDDTPTTEKIILFNAILFFTSRHRQNEFQDKLKKYVKECDDPDNFIRLGKLLSYIKISDIKLCDFYWDKALKFLKDESQNCDIIKMSLTYVNFSTDRDNYRHEKFENETLNLLADLTQDVNYKFFPQKLASVLNFVLLYGNDLHFLEYLVSNVEENWEQLKPIDCLKLSYTLKLFNQMDKKYVKLSYAGRVHRALDKLINKEVVGIDKDIWKSNSLLKSCVYKNRIETSVINELLYTYDNFDFISSKNIENIYYCFLMTNTLIPEVVENIITYILTYKNHVLGFNVGRVVYMCYCQGYHPKKVTELCETAVDIIIRDQKRMTGLLLIYSAIALCFFNKLPNSLIRSIFNVEFMDKLDDELHQCYAKDKYPQRVRAHLMQLNRAVCLDYPESNVPWFHQKYVDENIRAKRKKPNLFNSKLKEYLTRIVHNKDALAENVVTPYGYEIDFVVKLNSQGKIADSESQCSKRLALLLIPEYGYTNKTSLLKGSFQLKRRHLEMLGYKVVLIRFSDLMSLYYPEERMEFLRRLLWPKNFSEINLQTCR